jgi:hypothetical protein
LAEKYLSITTYAYVANDPVSLLDPNGAEIDFSIESGERNWENDIIQLRSTNPDFSLNYFAVDLSNNNGNKKSQKNSDPTYVATYDGPEVVVSAPRSPIIMSGANNNFIEDRNIATTIGVTDALGANAANNISKYIQGRGFSGPNSNIYGKSLSQRQILSLRFKTNLGTVKGKNVVRLYRGVDYFGKGAAAFGYITVTNSAIQGEITPERAAVDLGVVTYGWRGGIAGAGFGIGYGILGPIITNTEAYQKIKHYYIKRTPGGRDGLLSTDYD